jgi:hypothetical protein
MVAAGSELRIISPFVQRGAIQRLFKARVPKKIQVITRFDLRDFYSGVSDLGALRQLLEMGTAIRGVQDLHAKVYLFGSNRAIVTSANLTESAWDLNHEFGFVSDEPEHVSRVGRYFEDLWSQAGQDLTMTTLAAWEKRVDKARRKVPPPKPVEGLTDEGVTVQRKPEGAVDVPDQAFVKFFATGGNRMSRDTLVIDEVRRAGSHWALSYPKGKRPRIVREGAVMFIGSLVGDEGEPNDVIVYGRAIGSQYQEDRDDASKADIRQRDWKRNWPHYIRVSDPEFMAGTLRNGVSLGALMSDLQADAFASTQENAAMGKGNTDPRKAYRRHGAVRLSREGWAWVNRQLDLAMQAHGKISGSEIAGLDWPAQKIVTVARENKSGEGAILDRASRTGNPG